MNKDSSLAVEPRSTATYVLSKVGYAAYWPVDPSCPSSLHYGLDGSGGSRGKIAQRQERGVATFSPTGEVLTCLGEGRIRQTRCKHKPSSAPPTSGASSIHSTRYDPASATHSLALGTLLARMVPERPTMSGLLRRRRECPAICRDVLAWSGYG